jgi:hypothetical protein
MNDVLILLSTSRPRGSRGAAMISVGGRSFAHLADSCTLLCQASYVSCLPLLRMALEALAVQKALLEDAFSPYEDWFAAGVTQEGAAIHIDVGRSKAASILAADDRLGELYRLLMDIAMPHFGGALLFAAPETSLQKAPLTFGDGVFHLGFAQLISGWLLLLAEQQRAAWRQLTATETAEDSDVGGALNDRGRCYVERVDDRWVFHNFRRAPSAQPKRVVLG